MKSERSGAKPGKRRGAQNWSRDGRFAGIERPYSREEVERLRGSVSIEHTLARCGAEKLWNLLHSEDFVAALGALTGNQAVQQVRAGPKAIYLSGCTVTADVNEEEQRFTLPRLCTT